MASRLTYRTVNLSSATAACKIGPQDVRGQMANFHIFQVNLCSGSSVPVSPLHTQHILRSLHVLKCLGLLFDLNKA